MDNLFAMQASRIILVNIILLHFIGYVVQHYLFSDIDWFIWLVVGCIDAYFGFRCGIYIQSIFKDALTGLYNRSYFYLFLDKVLVDMRIKKTFTSLLMVDIDKFKKVNDVYGHLTGDIILKQVGNALQQNVRKNDCVFRWGGEEFIIVLPATDRESAIDIAESLRICIENYNFNAVPVFLKLTISIGLVCVNECIDRDSMVNSADKALYEAKIKRNTVTVY
ncbi:GGDEF domain-containing protein [Pelosinus sp. sgz500959]|uniref:GGDEF domain-containing protein n=1 Tax=Pelosinus sp. sgz500959 TaxID=3242472 RepID=UPI00366FF654